jgi:hypothetical protein
MADKTPNTPDKKSVSSAKQTRDDRLKAALKVNLARRKAQTRARNGPQAKTESNLDSKT